MKSLLLSLTDRDITSSESVSKKPVRILERHDESIPFFLNLCTEVSNGYKYPFCRDFSYTNIQYIQATDFLKHLKALAAVFVSIPQNSQRYRSCYKILEQDVLP